MEQQNTSFCCYRNYESPRITTDNSVDCRGTIRILKEIVIFVPTVVHNFVAAGIMSLLESLFT